METYLQLPSSDNLSTQKLGNVFANTTATYKYYWFLSILDMYVKKGKEQMVIWEIISDMVASAWYPIHYFRLSFGKLDSFAKQIRAIRDVTNLPIDMDKDDLVREIIEYHDQTEMKKHLRIFTQNVPFRFLRPWINTSDDREMAKRSETFENGCLYSLNRCNSDWVIKINPEWHDYLTNNYEVLKGFAYWNLANFVQARNPNVPNITGKLIKPLTRNTLSSQHKLWDKVIESLGGIQCIYTDKSLNAGDYDLDHFIPWSFVAHDQLWNLIPSDPTVNSSKGNKLPDLDRYLSKLAQYHQKAVSVIYGLNPSDKLLEDYCAIIDTPSDLINMDLETLLSKFRKTFCPLFQIASNMGFEIWTYN